MAHFQGTVLFYANLELAFRGKKIEKGTVQLINELHF
jgi:hypothetical protein